MSRIIVMLPAVVLLIITGCGPTNRERSEMVQCRHELQRVYISLEQMIQNPTNASRVSNIVFFHGIGECPVSKRKYVFNPISDKWLLFDQYRSDIAIYCPSAHFGNRMEGRFAAIKFDGSFENLTNAVVWEKQGIP